MFGSLKDMAGLAGMLKDLPRIKARMDEVRQRLDSMTVQAESGGGAVRVTATGSLKVKSIEIDQALLTGLVDAGDPDDRHLAGELIVGAVNAALEKARREAEQEFSQVAGELGIPIPPGGIGGLLG